MAYQDKPETGSQEVDFSRNKRPAPASHRSIDPLCARNPNHSQIWTGTMRAPRPQDTHDAWSHSV